MVVMAHDLLEQFNLLLAVDFSIFLMEQLIELKVASLQGCVLAPQFF